MPDTSIPGHELPEGRLAFVTTKLYQGALITRQRRDLHSVIACPAFSIFGGGAEQSDPRNEVRVNPLPKGTALVLS